MKIRTFRSIENGVFRVNIQTEDWSEGDLALMAKHSEPEIDLGGDFTGPPSFTLPSKLERVRSESPFRADFDGEDDSNAKDNANTWADTMEIQIAAAVTNLRAEVDDFTDEKVTSAGSAVELRATQVEVGDDDFTKETEIEL